MDGRKDHAKVLMVFHGVYTVAYIRKMVPGVEAIKNSQT